MIKVDWRKDYKREFACPRCEQSGMRLVGKHSLNKKRNFKCLHCGKNCSESLDIYLKAVYDPDSKTTWYTNHKIEEFVCPNDLCLNRNIRFLGFYQGKKRFECKSCGKLMFDSTSLSVSILSKYGRRLPGIKAFTFEDNEWDLRALNPDFDNQERKVFVNFRKIEQAWFKLLVKQYIYHFCQLYTPFSTIYSHSIRLRCFARYLNEKNVSSIEEINRDVVLSFLAWGKLSSQGVKNRLYTLRNFFKTGNLKSWFEVDQHVIREEDYPKARKSNPDPISDTVRKQIEQNLHKLPNPIARMWIIALFCALRPSELASLKKDCLVQEGGDWKLVWQRPKTKDQHEVPITRTIAKVVQEQQNYINQLWGSDWDYLFCHYQEISAKDPTHPKLKPVKRVIPKIGSPLQKAIRCLIQAENIKDENGKLAQFRPSLVRHTRLTQLFNQGHDLVVVSAWAGHRRLATTSTYYTQVSCELIEKEVGHLQKALFNAEGKPLHYESLPKSFWKNPRAHELELPGDHINTPIYGHCGLPLNQDCHQFRACYTCRCFVATPEKWLLYTKTRDELRAKESRARANGADVLVEQYQRQADNLDKIIVRLEGEML